MPITYDDILKLKYLDCSNIEDMRGTYILNSVLLNAENTDFRGAILYGCYSNSDIKDALAINPKPSEHEVRYDSKGADLMFASLEGADLRGAIFRSSYLNMANLVGADLEKSDFRGATLIGIDLENADMGESNLQNANVEQANLRGVNLQGANLQGTYLYETDFQNANLQEANLQNANLKNANLRGANLHDADFRGANLEGANISFAIISRDTEYPKEFKDLEGFDTIYKVCHLCGGARVAEAVHGIEFYCEDCEDPYDEDW